MKTFLVRTNREIEYVFKASRFEFVGGIVIFYDEDGNIKWVIKNWESFMEQQEKKITPDEAYENLEQGET